MTIHVRGDWHYDLSISSWEGKFVWNVIRMKIDLKRTAQATLGTLVASGIAATRQEADREGVAAIDREAKSAR